MFLIVDVQGFKTSDKTFTPKELAVFNGTQISHFIFKPPFAFNLLPDHLKKQATWVFYNHHGIDWNQGFTPVYQFEKILKTLTQHADGVYVKGREKMLFIKKYIDVPIFEINEHPPIKHMETKCFYHAFNNCVCALSNVYYFYNDIIMKQ